MKKSFLLFFLPLSIGYIIGIDFGTQFIKVAYQPFNRPPDIVPDPSGKRKIANAVYFGEDMRAFGNNAEGYAKLRPKSIFMGVNELLGQGGESNIPASFQQRGYPYEFVLTERNTWSLKLLPGSGFDDIPSVSAEELSAMVLDYIVSIVEKEYGEASREVVLSVPSSFSQHQRQALLDAAQLANIHVVAMIDQTTASAVTYAMTRHDDGFKRFILYDIGSRYTECSAVEVETVHENGVSKKNVVILGKETIPIGGSDFTAVISSIIADRFEQQYREDPLQDMKVVARLRENSQKYKEILSANREVQINEPNLLAGKDIQFVLYREEFEEDSMTLFDKLLRVLQNLIERLNLNINEFSEIQLVGGSSRIPRFKTMLQKIVGSIPVLLNLNGDDSAALGCVYYASGPKFMRTKLEKVWDIPYYPIYTTFYRPRSPYDSVGGFSEDYITSNHGKMGPLLVFSALEGYEHDRSFTFPAASDFQLQLHYRQEWRDNRWVRLTPCIREYRILGINEIIRSIPNFLGANVTVEFHLDEFGMVRVQKAELNSRYLSREDRLAEQRYAGFPFFRRDRWYDSMVEKRGRDRTDALKVVEMTDGLTVFPMATKDFHDSKRRLKQMFYRDEKTRKEQRKMNEMESCIDDAEVTMEEESFQSHSSEQERELLKRDIEEVRHYLQQVHDKQVLFDASAMQATLQSIQNRLDAIEQRTSEDEL